MFSLTKQQVLKAIVPLAIGLITVSTIAASGVGLFANNGDSENLFNQPSAVFDFDEGHGQELQAGGTSNTVGRVFNASWITRGKQTGLRFQSEEKSYVSITSPYPRRVSEATITLRVRIDKPSGPQSILSRGFGHAMYPRIFIDEKGVLIFQWKEGGITRGIETVRNLETGSHHIAFIFDREHGVTAIVDGEIVGERRPTGQPYDGGEHKILIGRDTNLDHRFDGVVWKVRLFESSLTVPEAYALAHHRSNTVSLFSSENGVTEVVAILLVLGIATLQLLLLRY